MIKQLKQLRNTYVVGALIIIILVLTDNINAFWLFWLFFLTIITIGIALYVMISQITCPTCGVPLLSRKAILSPDKCYNCGRDLNGPKPSKRDIANDLFDRYGDERTAKTNWQPIRTETANFDTHKLHVDKKGQPVFKQTFGNSVFAGMFLILGLLAYTITYAVTYNADWYYRLIGAFPLLFVIAGLYLAYLAMTPIHIDQRRGLFILGWSRDKHVKLRAIEALQLLPYRVARKSGGYINTQLNLVLKGGERRMIVTYYNQKKALQDAEQLAEHLGVKIWDATDGKK